MIERPHPQGVAVFVCSEELRIETAARQANLLGRGKDFV